MPATVWKCANCERVTVTGLCGCSKAAPGPYFPPGKDR